jgi:hypothetical protein
MISQTDAVSIGSGRRIELAGNGMLIVVGVDWLTGRVSVIDAQ